MDQEYPDEMQGVRVDKLVVDLLRFTGAHLDELSTHEVFVLGQSVGIVARVHSGYPNPGAANGDENGT